MIDYIISTTKISPATAMHYAETVGNMPPRYIEGKRFYKYWCEGEQYTVDVLQDDAPSDMHKVWASEVNEGAVANYYNEVESSIDGYGMTI